MSVTFCMIPKKKKSPVCLHLARWIFYWWYWDILPHYLLIPRLQQPSGSHANNMNSN